MYHNYQPGKSHLIMSSICYGSHVTNEVKRTGYFDDQDGIYFEQDGNGILSFNIRSYVSSAPINTKVIQSQWNVDKFNGNGPSKINLNILNTQLLFIDFQWLGVGRVRCGFAHDGKFILAHEFFHSNNINTVYMSNPTLPIRCEIFNTGTTTGGSFDQICSTVISESGYKESGIDFSYISASRNLHAAESLPILCLKLSPTLNTYLNRIIVRLNNLTVFSDSGNITYKIIKLNSAATAITTGSWSNVDTNSGMMYNQAATNVVGSLTNVMSSGFVGAGGNGVGNQFGTSQQNSGSDAKRNYIANNIDCSDSQIYIIYCTNIDSKSTNVSISLQWRELY
jgi:hypothetical protein